MRSFASTVAWRPTTAFILSSATVVAGLLRSTFSRIPAGSTSASTLSPTLSAVVGSTLFSTTSCRRSLSVQSCSSPKVSKRKTRWPSATLREMRRQPERWLRVGRRAFGRRGRDAAATDGAHRHRDEGHGGRMSSEALDAGDRACFQGHVSVLLSRSKCTSQRNIEHRAGPHSTMLSVLSSKMSAGRIGFRKLAHFTL